MAAGCNAMIWCLLLAVTVEVILNTAVAEDPLIRPTTDVFGNAIVNANATTTTKPSTLPYDPNNVATVPVAVPGMGGSSPLPSVPSVAKATTALYVPPNPAAGSQAYANTSVAGGGPEPVTTVPAAAAGGAGSQPLTMPAAAGGVSQPVTRPSAAAGGGSQPVTMPAAAGGVSQPFTVPASSFAGSQPMSTAAPNVIGLQSQVYPVPSAPSNDQTNYPGGPLPASNTPLYNGQGQGQAQTSFPPASSNAPIVNDGVLTTPVYMYNNLRVQVNAYVIPNPMNTVYNPQVAMFLANLAHVSDPARIQNISYQTSPSDSYVTILQFAITQPTGSIPTSDVALSNLKTSIQMYSPTWTSSDGKSTIRLSTPVLNWTDYGPCPNTTCLNGGRCVSSVTGTLSCQCLPSYIGPDCAVAATMSGGSGGQPLLGLLVIPILFVLILIGLIAAYFIMRRRQEEKKVPQVDNDVSSIYTPSKFGTVSEQGVRNMAYPTIGKSYAVAFTDNSFSTMESSDSNGDRSMGLF